MKGVHSSQERTIGASPLVLQLGCFFVLSHQPPETNIQETPCYTGPHVCTPWCSGPIGHQTAGQHPSWAVPTPPPLSPPPPMSAVATLCQSSPTVSPLGAPLARNCTRPPSRLWRGTLYGTSPVKTPGVPPQSWGWMNR